MTKDQKDIGLFAVTFLGFGAFWYAYLTGGSHEIATIPKEAATAAVVQAVPSSVSFTEIAHGWKSTVEEPTNYVLTSPDQLAEVWKMLGTKDAPPQVDFSRQAVIAVFAGQTSDPKATIAVTQITDSTDRHVVVTITDAGVSCTGTCPLGAPYQLIVVPATALPLTSEYVFSTPPVPGAKTSTGALRVE